MTNTNLIANLVAEVTEEIEPTAPAANKKMVAFDDDEPRKARKNPERPKTSKSTPATEPTQTETQRAASQVARGLTRPVVPMTIRFRPELAEGVKRVILERRLRGEKPDTIQEALNEAVTTWLSQQER